MSHVALLFERWIERQPVRVRHVIAPTPHHNGLDLAITHCRLGISGWLSDYELTVAAELGGACWDFLLSLDVEPIFVEGSYRCRSCPVGAKGWVTIDELIIEHLLDPLGRWIEQALLPSKALAYFGGDGATWARLVADTGQAEGAVAVIRA